MSELVTSTHDPLLARQKGRGFQAGVSQCPSFKTSAFIGKTDSMYTQVQIGLKVMPCRQKIPILVYSTVSNAENMFLIGTETGAQNRQSAGPMIV